MNGEHGKSQMEDVQGKPAGLHCDEHGLVQPAGGEISAVPLTGGRPPQRLSEESRKVVLAIYGALDLKSSQLVKEPAFHRHTALGVLDEFTEIVRCIDADFAQLLSPDNTLATAARS